MQHGDTSRDALTLDLFGNPVGADAPGIDNAAQPAASKAATVAPPDTQSTLVGFDVPAIETIDAGAARDEADQAGHVSTGSAMIEIAPADAAASSSIDAVPETVVEAEAAVAEPNTGDAQRASAGSMQHDATPTVANGETADRDRAASPDIPDGNRSSAAESADSPHDAPEAAVAPPRAARPQRGAKRRAAGARSESAPRGAAPQPATPTEQKTPQPASPPSETEAGTRVAAPAAALVPAWPPESAATPTEPAVAPAASAAPALSASTPPPSVDLDAQVGPLADRLAALQADAAGLRSAADREMRRVNRLLLALAVVVLAGLAALLLQALALSGARQDAAAQQQRIDRLVADQLAQQATLATLEQHNEMLAVQVNRLERVGRDVVRPTAGVKRTRRGRAPF
ncbi:hypothetical protein LIG30_0048 [Burkholderia sp. lig30]|jgi:hypothetical protein|nr:hypothetical protein LIG30_0048 [Burkholderia sp. lig30]